MEENSKHVLKDFLFRKKSLVIQLIKFGIVGLSNTALSYVLYMVFLKLFEHYTLFPAYDYLLSSIMTFIICIAWTFYWNNSFTFRKEDGERRNYRSAFIKTVFSYALTGLLLHNVLLYILVEVMGIAKIIAPLINLTVTVPLNFLLNKFWAFKTKGSDK